MKGNTSFTFAPIFKLMINAKLQSNVRVSFKHSNVEGVFSL